MKYRFWILALLALSLTGCYTSFAPRDYEMESYGQMDNYDYDSSNVAENIDTSEFYYPEEEFYYDSPVQELTVINNYGSDWWGGYNSPYYSNIYTSYGFYSPFYDPFYDPYYSPYYGPYYGGNFYVYGNYYSGYGYGYDYYPSSVRHRTNRNHWTSLRNNGGRGVVSRSREGNRGRTRNNDITRDEFRIAKGFDLDRDLQVAKIASTSGRTSNKGGLRTAGYTRDGNSRNKAKRTTDIERRRISNKTKNGEVIGQSKSSKNKRTQRISKNSRIKNNSSNSKRSKRVYSSKRIAKNRNSSKNSSRTYYKQPTKSSNRSKVSRSSRSSNSNSSGYRSSNNSSRSSSSRSSVSRSSGRSSSRSSVSRSSGRSSSSSRSTSGRSSRRR